MINVDINLLRTFLEIEKTRHFGKASENLYLTQAAISARIKLLEETLGSTLFERHRNNIQLTKQGTKLVPYATQMVDLWVRTTQEIKVPVDRNDLTIAAPESVWTSRLSNFPNKLFSSDNKLQLVVESLTSNMITRRLIDRTLDIGCLYDLPKIEELELVKTISISLSLYTNSVDFKMSDVEENNFVSIDLGLSFRTIQANLLPNVSSPVFQASNWQMAIDYIEDFNGVALLPASLAKTKRKLFALSDAPVIKREIYICYNRSVLNNPAKAELITNVIDLLD